MDKPLFVPLMRQWFEAFARGEKHAEWRRYGGPWNERTCRIGRRVTLSLGYTHTRIAAEITSFAVRPATGPAAELYGKGTPCAVIGIKLTRKGTGDMEPIDTAPRNGDFVEVVLPGNEIVGAHWNDLLQGWALCQCGRRGNPPQRAVRPIGWLPPED